MVAKQIAARLFMTLIGIRRSKLAVFTLISVGCVTLFALVGLHPSYEWVTLQEALILGGMNLVFAAVYFELISPSRDQVPPIVTMTLAIFGGVIGTLTLDLPLMVGDIDYSEFISASAFLILIIGNWLWYEVVYLESFKDRLDEMMGVVPLPDSVEDALTDAIDEETEENEHDHDDKHEHK